MDTTKLLQLVRDERARSIGFEHDAELTGDRELALDYFNGDMNDLDVVENTSTATSSDVADAIETVLPDIVEVFTTEEVAAFVPTSEQDVPQAEQETDYVNHVVLSDNNGFVLLNTMFKDALQLKTGIAMAQWEDCDDPEPEEFSGGQLDAMASFMSCQANGSTFALTHDPKAPADLVTWTVTPKAGDGRVKVEVIAPEDFTVSADTVKLSESPYCAYRTRMRRSHLIADGFDADQVEELPSYEMPFSDDAVSRARSTAGENDPGAGGETRETDLVEVVHHFVRVLKGARLVLMKVVTGADETVLLSSEKVSAIPFAAVTPYINTHRFYGQSLADKMLEVQRIKTQMLRLMLNAGYFAQNGRVIVPESAVGKHTLSDLMDNRPGQFVRVKDGGEGVRPFATGALGFDAFQALEYASVMGEQRSGVVRNAQGLNPDSLHDTAQGMTALHNAALKRVRYMARMFAETGVKDLFLLVHDLLRTHARQARLVRMRGKFVQVDPSRWAMRDTMAIEIGVGGGGREHDLAMLGQVLQQQQAAVTAGALQAGLLTPKNLFNAATKWASRAGFKAPEMFWSDPTAAPQQPAPPKPDPEMMKLQLQAQTAQAAHGLEQQKLALEAQRVQMDSEHRDADRQAQFRAQLMIADQKSQADVYKAQMATAQRADQTHRELGLKAGIADSQAQIEAAKLDQADRHHVEDHMAAALGAAHDATVTMIGQTHKAHLDHLVKLATPTPEPKAITGGPVHVGGEPG